ncbi:hypothetical protein FRC17_000995 [Serendipita sp. 399]|nr:hypothetical protein FRC17_000995 [Serendipita sp. 399]
MPKKKKSAQKSSSNKRQGLRKRHDSHDSEREDADQGAGHSVPPSATLASHSDLSEVKATSKHPNRRTEQHIPTRKAIDSLQEAVKRDSQLLPPLEAALYVLKLLARAEKPPGELKVLELHLQTIENQISKLEEDNKVDNFALSLDSTVKEPLELYASQLEIIYKIFYEDQSATAAITRKTGKTSKQIPPDIDATFQAYTKALHLYVAKTVDQTRNNLSQMRSMTLKRPVKTDPLDAQHITVSGNQHDQCLHGTREKTLDAIRHWVDEESPVNQIFCLMDVAGSGKSTISKHIAVEWRKERRLMVQHFFSRDTLTTMSTKSFCTTIADAFAHRDPTFKHTMNEFKASPGYKGLPFEDRFEGLVADPLKTVNRQAILIIDALDECDDSHGERECLLRALAKHLPSIKSLRIFVTARPEKDIKIWAAETPRVLCTNFMELEGGSEDVERYIKHRLNRWKADFQDMVYSVIARAEGLFIWARIACDLLVKTTNVRDLLESLGKKVTLEHLYTVALEESVPREEFSHQATLVVLEMILAAREPLSIAELEKISLRPDVVEAVVFSLGSILLYQGRNDPIRLLHATLREFLTDSSKSGQWFTRIEMGNHILASGCFSFLNSMADENLDDLMKDEVSKRQESSKFDDK